MLTVQKLKCGDVINKVEIKNGYTKRFVFCCCFRIGFWNVFKTSLIHHFLRISLIIADVGVSVNHKWLNEKVCVIFNRFFITNSTKFNLILMWGGVSRLFRCSVSTQDLGFLNTFVLEIMIRMYTNDVSKLLNKTSLASIRLIRKITQYREIFNTESPRFFLAKSII